jgi:hypothetical protein
MQRYVGMSRSNKKPGLCGMFAHELGSAIGVLVAPLGTIDAGEAGIRVSGNVDLAALQIYA